MEAHKRFHHGKVVVRGNVVMYSIIVNSVLTIFLFVLLFNNSAMATLPPPTHPHLDFNLSLLLKYGLKLRSTDYEADGLTTRPRGYHYP